MSGAIGGFTIGVSGIGVGSTPAPTPTPTPGGGTTTSQAAALTIAGTTTVFAPTANQVFTFQAVLDGAPYNVSVTWNVYRGGGNVTPPPVGWCYNVYSQSNDLVVASPLIGSPPPGAGRPNNLVGGYFNTSTMYFYPPSQTFLVAP